MTTYSPCIHDENIDYDSSFELVDEEKIDTLDDTKSESFQFVSSKGETTNEVNIDSNENSIPIVTSIVGKWKPVSSKNLETYCKSQQLGELAEMAWKHGIVCYEVKDGIVHVHTELLDKKLNFNTFNLGVRIEKGQSSVICRIENNKLNTFCTKLIDGTELWRVERFIQNGKLVILNQFGEIKCERYYERIV
uniref:FABP domain-containing protein n=1 Tax=Caenorhabditis tropicalis TaxID=1561998 RepID=A0A1I7TSS8_9PELO